MDPTRVDPLLLQIVRGTARNSVNGFLVERQSRQFSPNTIKLYGLELGYFCTFLDQVGVETLVELTPDTIRRCLLNLSEHRNAGGCHAPTGSSRPSCAGPGMSSSSRGATRLHG